MYFPSLLFYCCKWFCAILLYFHCFLSSFINRNLIMHSLCSKFVPIFVYFQKGSYLISNVPALHIDRQGHSSPLTDEDMVRLLDMRPVLELVRKGKGVCNSFNLGRFLSLTVLTNLIKIMFNWFTFSLSGLSRVKWTRQTFSFAVGKLVNSCS